MGSVIKGRELVILMYAVPTLFLILEYFLIPSGNIISDIGNQLLAWTQILFTMSYLIGGYALFRYHLTLIQRQREGYKFSYLLLGTFIVFLLLGILKSVTGLGLYDWLWSNALLPLQIGMLSYVGFYTYTVFYRGARSRSWEAGVLLFVAILLMFYSAPYGTAYWSGFETIGNWIKDVPQMAGQRAIVIGMAVGLIAIFVRTLLGLERAQLGEL